MKGGKIYKQKLLSGQKVFNHKLGYEYFLSKKNKEDLK